jgi:putative two-component system response regulator
MQPPSGSLFDHASVPDLVAEPGRILVVDDTPAASSLLRDVLTRAGYRVNVTDQGKKVAGVMRDFQPDVVLLDVLMPDLSGFEVCRCLKSDPETKLVPVVLVTGLGDSDSRVQGFNAGADDFVTKPFNISELRARVRSLVRLKRYTDDLDSAQATLISLALTIEARDPLMNGHCQRLAAYAERLGFALNLPAEDLTSLRRGAFLHDIGKVGIPDAILLKPGPLTPSEFETMQAHTVIGDHLCSALRSLGRVRPIVRHHHERLNGTGYPDGLFGDAIPLLAQITGIVDVFDALTVARPYRAAMSVPDALAVLANEAARGWRDKDLVDTWIHLQSVQP